MRSSDQLQYDYFLAPGCQCQSISCSLVAATILSCLAFLFLSCSPGLAQSEQVLDQVNGQINRPESPRPSPNANAQFREQPDGTVTGRVVDQTGNGVAGADVKLLGDQKILMGEVQTDDDGQFAFAHVSSGPLQFSIAAEGFTTQTVSGTLRSGENQVLPPVKLSLTTPVTEIRVTPLMEEIAKEQFKEQERQRVFGIIPNFYVTYLNDAAALSAKQKFQLALKASTDPVTGVAVAAIAGLDQAANRFSGYGQGAQGYSKRFAASYGNLASRLFIGGAVLPSILKQDPRYFYNGTGTKRSRLLYAISRTVICKGDNQRWQPNYSSIFGDLAAGGISNLYIPERDHHGARLTFENAAVALGTTAAINVLQEFVLRRVTSKRRTSN